LREVLQFHHYQVVVVLVFRVFLLALFVFLVVPHDSMQNAPKSDGDVEPVTDEVKENHANNGHENVWILSHEKGCPACYQSLKNERSSMFEFHNDVGS
jgi:hypothetical protein